MMGFWLDVLEACGNLHDMPNAVGLCSRVANKVQNFVKQEVH
jgi:hypothetical protein